MPPLWLQVIAWLALASALLCAAIILIDLRRHPQKMPIMDWVWPITALYAGPLAVWLYWKFGRRSSPEVTAQNSGKTEQRPFWATVAIGATHCGAGCTVGDIVAESTIFSAGITVGGSVLGAEYVGDYALAYILGIVFQYFTIVPMRGLSFGPGVWAAIKADTLSLTAFEVGLFGWMAIMNRMLFSPHLQPNQPTYWFMMQIGMLIGYATSYPMNWWLIRRGIKEAM